MQKKERPKGKKILQIIESAEKQKSLKLEHLERWRSIRRRSRITLLAQEWEEGTKPDMNEDSTLS